MKSAIIIGALASLAAAAPAPQLIDLDGVASIFVPEAGPSSGLSVAEGYCALRKVGAHRLMSQDRRTNLSIDGYGPKATPDTVEGFYAFQTFADQSSQAPTPKGYSRTFQGHTGSCSAGTYLGLFFKSFDPYFYQQQCNSHPDGCTSFNIFSERDPTVDAGPACANPPSFTTVRCTLWKNTLMPKEGAGNDGQYRAP